jgi:hypothetical protein
MSGRGRQAALPLQGHTRSPAKTATGLLVTHVSEKGDERRSYDFATLAIREPLQRELAEVFAARLWPFGDWRTVESSGRGWAAIRGVVSTDLNSLSTRGGSFPPEGPQGAAIRACEPS